MPSYTIKVIISEAQDTAMQGIATKAGKPVAKIFQEFWDGYVSDGVAMTGAVKAQVDQWIADELKAKIETLDSATVLSLLP